MEGFTSKFTPLARLALVTAFTRVEIVSGDIFHFETGNNPVRFLPKLAWGQGSITINITVILLVNMSVNDSNNGNKRKKEKSSKLYDF